MNFKLLSLEIGAILIAYTILMLPVAGATSVNILFNEQVQATVDISPQNLVNKQVTWIHPPADITWSRVKVLVSLSSASLAKSISKIYLYKCKTANPVDCVKGEPLVFQSYIDTELAWADISQKIGPGFYPQEANLLILVKLEGERDTWTGFWDKIVRTKHNVFSTYSHELASLDFYVSSLELVEPVQHFIENYQMIPFNWANRVVFTGATSLFGIGADTDEIDVARPAWQTAQPATNQIDAIAKDYFFILGNTTSGVANPITLTKNPSFTCGDSDCEADLGESSANCCYDCGCPDGQYCDVSDPETKAGSCKSEAAVTLTTPQFTAPQLTDCTRPFDLEIVTGINNPPTGLPETIPAVLTINTTPYTITCTGSPVRYTCPITLTPEVQCGKGLYEIGPNTLTMTLSYQDGPNPVTRDLSGTFSSIPVNYNCACPADQYCDAGTKTCEQESLIGMTARATNAYMEDYQPGDTINVVVTIDNPPTGLTVDPIVFHLGNITADGTAVQEPTSGTPVCTGGLETNHVYNCSIPFSTGPSYDHTKQYIIRGNNITATLSFPSGDATRTLNLEASFSDVTIPSYRCGDGTCNPPEEDQTNCCHDCGCPEPGVQYCNPESVQGCQYLADVDLTIKSVSPRDFSNCRVQHQSKVIAVIGNNPSGLQIDQANYFLEGQFKEWIQCAAPVYGETECILTIPPQDGACQETLGGAYEIGPNNLSLVLTFADGHGTKTKTVAAGPAEGFDSIFITPSTDCGDGMCETDLGENGTNCCIDCPCDNPDYFRPPAGTTQEDWYCDYDRQLNPDGTCKQISAINLSIDSVAPVEFSTCELTNKVNIQAHIANPPSGVRAEGWSAKLDNQDVQFFHCRQEERFGNLSYNCTLRIPKVHNCTAGRTVDGEVIPAYDHIHKDNSISAFVTYPDGQAARRSSQILASPIPNIHVFQEDKTTWDITEEWQEFVLDRVDRLESLVERTIDRLEDCIEWMRAAALFGLFLTASTAAGLIPGVEDRWKGVEAGAKTTETLITAVAKICDMIRQTYELTRIKLQTEIQMESMRRCLAMVHHDMDLGKCDGQEEACFERIKGCLTAGFQELDNFAAQMDRVTDNIVEDARAISRSVQEAARAWDAAMPEPQGDLIVQCDHRTGTCCEHYGPKSGTPTIKIAGVTVAPPEARRETGEHCNWAKLKVILKSVEDCPIAERKVKMDGQTIDISTYNPIVKNAGWSDGQKILFEAFCDGEKFEEATITFVKDDNNDCVCNPDEYPPGVGPSGTSAAVAPRTTATLAKDVKGNIDKALASIQAAIDMNPSGWGWGTLIPLGIKDMQGVEGELENARAALNSAKIKAIADKYTETIPFFITALTHLDSAKTTEQKYIEEASTIGEAEREAKLRDYIQKAIDYTTEAKRLAKQYETAKKTDYIAADFKLVTDPPILTTTSVQVSFDYNCTEATPESARIELPYKITDKRTGKTLKTGTTDKVDTTPKTQTVTLDPLPAGSHTLRLDLAEDVPEYTYENNFKELTVTVGEPEKARVVSDDWDHEGGIVLDHWGSTFCITFDKGMEVSITNFLSMEPSPAQMEYTWVNVFTFLDVSVSKKYCLAAVTEPNKQYKFTLDRTKPKTFEGGDYDPTGKSTWTKTTPAAPRPVLVTHPFVKTEKKIYLNFDKAMLTDKPAPIRITPSIPGEGEWSDGNTRYVFNASALDVEVEQYTVEILKDNLISADGWSVDPVKTVTSFTFSPK